MSLLLSYALRDIRAERQRQDRKWGEQNHEGLYWLSILTEEVGEVAKELADGRAHGLNRAAYRTELIHTAAVAIAAIESLDRNGC